MSSLLVFVVLVACALDLSQCRTVVLPDTLALEAGADASVGAGADSGAGAGAGSSYTSNQQGNNSHRLKRELTEIEKIFQIPKSILDAVAVVVNHNKNGQPNGGNGQTVGVPSG